MSQNIHVEGVGAFVLKKRTLRNEIAIGAEFNRLTEGQADVSGWFRDLCEMVAFLKVMVEHAPDGWNLDDMDPTPDLYKRIVDVYREALATGASKSP